MQCQVCILEEIRERLMKVPDSGMPEEDYWNSLFDIPAIISWLELPGVRGPVAEFGCGYGTFTIPVASQLSTIVHAFDIDSSMIGTASENARRAGTHNIQFRLRDVAELGSGLPAESVALVLLFNLLHSDHKRLFLIEACRILEPFGRIAIIHWRKDIETPRGPRQALRPDLQILLQEAKGLGLHVRGRSNILEPYHWGMQFIKGPGDENGKNPNERWV